jgi:putative DNA primase/helicase
MDCPWDTPTPMADKFYSQVMCGDAEMIAFFKRREGYFMTGEMSDRSGYLDWGSGSNMKGTTTLVRSKIMSEFAVPLSKDVMIETEKGGAGAATPHLMPLVHARIGVLSETKEGDKLAGDFLKSVSGNDEISCRDVYSKQFKFQPQVKLVLQTNHKPDWDVNDQASVDRFKLVPYLASVKVNPTAANEVKRDIQFVEDLLTVHLDEVFRWIVQGAVDWYQNGRDLTLPSTALDALGAYIGELDTVERFIKERCEQGEWSTPKSELYTGYAEWCRADEGVIQKKKVFYATLKKKGFREKKVRGNREIVGLRVLQLVSFS